MQLHQIKIKLKKKKKIGRGGKRGSYSGRGIKGQKSRAGRRIRPALRDVILKFPKKRGLGNIKINNRVLKINLEKIERNFQNGELVSLNSLKEKNILKVPKSIKKYKIKILAKGNFNKSLVFKKSDFLFSKKALKKIDLSQSKIE